MNDQTQNPIGYCGLNCAECFSYTKTVSEAAKALRRELRTAKLKDFWTDVPFLGEYESFKKSLDGLAKLRCTRMCRNGGGNPWCKIRSCAVKKGYHGCWDCADFESCKTLNALLHAKLENLKKMKKRMEIP